MKSLIEKFILTVFCIILFLICYLLYMINVWLPILFLGIMLILMKKFYPNIRGYFGEFWIKVELSKLPRRDYKVINNLTINNGQRTVQIDHLVISKYGIFVLEMKNYYGLILGNEYSEQWTQVLGRKKFPFYSPIRQNYGHIKSLENVLNISESNFISIIVFSNQSRLKVKASNTHVVYLDNILKIIKKYDQVKINDIELIYNKIMSLNIKDKKIIKQHLKDIKTTISKEQELIDSKVCPRCSGELVERVSKRGPFIGCSNYPKCRFLRNI